MNENHTERTGGWWVILAALPMALCCGLPIIVGALGVGAAAAIFKYGLPGLGVAALLGLGLYLLRAGSSRRHGDAGAGSFCGCAPTVTTPRPPSPAAEQSDKGP